MPNHPPLYRRRSVLWLLAGLASLVLAWFAGSHWLLNSAWLPERLSQLEGIEISWENGRSTYPGRWEVENFHLAREDRELALSVGAERATLTLSLHALLRGELRIRSLDARGIRRLTLNDLVLEGAGALRLTDSVFTARQLEISNLELHLESGRLRRDTDGVTLVRDIGLAAQASLVRIAPTEIDAEALEALSGSLQMDAHADAWDVFTPYLEPLPWLTVSGHGRLQGDLTMARGVLLPGSELRLDSPELRVEVDESRLREDLRQERDPATHRATGTTHRAQGDGAVLVAVTREHPEWLTFITRLRDVSLADTEPYAHRAELTLSTEMENRRLDQLEAPARTSLTLRGEVVRLDMIDPYLTHLFDGRGIQLRGAGKLKAELEALGRRPNQARLEISAPQMRVMALGYDARGGGTLHAGLENDVVSLDVLLDGATLHHQARQLLADADLRLTAMGPLDPKPAIAGARGEIAWQSAHLPDIAVLQPYLEPFLADPAPLRLLGGSARSEGQLSVVDQRVRGSISLSGQKLRTELRGHSVENAVQLSLELNEATLDGTWLDLSGSRLRWQARGDAPEAQRLESDLLLRQTVLQRREGTRTGQFALEGRIQQLGFLNTFLPDAHGLALKGNGMLDLEGGFENDRILPGTQLRIAAEQLRVGFLDHLASGRGELSARLDTPEQAHLALKIPLYSLQRQDDDRPQLQGRDLVVTTRTGQFSQVLAAPEARHFTTRISLPDTEVPDFARYNDYLPGDAGVTLLGGRARMASEFELTALAARGAVNLQASGVELALLDQLLRGDLHLDLRLEDGDLATRRFNAAHSFLRLDRIQRQNGEQPGDADWWVQLDFDDARLRWTDRVDLTSRLTLTMRDTGLLARLFLARARDREWLGRLLDVRDIEGRAELDLNDTRIRLGDVDLRGENLTVLADLTLADGVSNGALYARLGALALGVELTDSEPVLRIVRPRRWFDAWRAEQPTIP